MPVADRSSRPFTAGNWDEKIGMNRAGGPLEGIGVLVTRAREQASSPVSDLEKVGAKVHFLPAIKIEEITEPEGLREAMEAIGGFDHLVFSSVNGVYSFLRHAGPMGLAPSGMPPAFCVGPKTAQAWRGSGGIVSGVPAKFTASSLADMLRTRLEGISFLILRPERTETDLAGLLRARGAKVREVILYRTVPEQAGRHYLARLLENGDLGAVMFASPSAVRGFLSMGGSGDAVRRLLAVCIGPVTARAAVGAGFEKILSPEVHTWDGMVEVLLAQADAIRKRRR